MPSQSKTTRSLCIYGDSHLGCVKLALDEGMPEAEAFDIEFWGSHGPAFRGLRMVDGAIRPEKGTEASIELINNRGRKELRPGDHDAILFHACRVRTFGIQAEFLHAGRATAAFVTAAARRQSLIGWLESVRSFRIAREFAATGKTRVAISTVPFPTAGIGRDPLVAKPEAREADAEERVAIWSEIAGLMDTAGIHFLPQPEETVTEGCLTRPEFASAWAQENVDPVHKNAAYGRLVLREAFNFF